MTTYHKCEDGVLYTDALCGFCTALMAPEVGPAEHSLILSNNVQASSPPHTHSLLPPPPLLPPLRRWAEEQDQKDVRAILHGIRNGFNRRGEEAEEEVRTALDSSGKVAGGVQQRSYGSFEDTLGIDTAQAFLPLRPLLQADTGIEARRGRGAFVNTLLLLNVPFLFPRMQDGTDLEARRRRAALFADDGELQVQGGVRVGVEE